MAYDAGMVALCAKEVKELSLGAKVEKVLQPTKDEIILIIRSQEGPKALLLSANTACPRLSFTEKERENPLVPPMLCMLLRKHLIGAKLVEVLQEGFERVITLCFDARDELGFGTKRYLIMELMGKYSNLIFTDAEKKILFVLHPIDITSQSARNLLSGMTYSLPPKQDRVNPLEETKEGFESAFRSEKENNAVAFLSSHYLGISKPIAREIVFLSCGNSDALVKEINGKKLEETFFSVVNSIKNGNFSPCIVSQEGKMVEYAFMPLTHYGKDFQITPYKSVAKLLDDYFGAKELANALHTLESDLLACINRAENRISKKLVLQQNELADCEKGESYKKCADLITANLYLLSYGMESAELTDYEDYKEDGTYGKMTVKLNPRFSPSANAQSYYKKYNKSKKAKEILTEQIAKDEKELYYLSTVRDALSRAKMSAEIEDIREELRESGYLAKQSIKEKRKRKPTAPKEFISPNGYKVLCGRNNLQNEELSHKIASKNDYWFHVKNAPGSHVILITNGEEPEAEDFTFSAQIAVENSKLSDSDLCEVDYTFVKNLKKPPSSPLGFVIYHTNWSCIVKKEKK